MSEMIKFVNNYIDTISKKIKSANIKNLELSAKEILFLNSGIGSFPVSPALPAKIDIINFVFL